VNNNKENENRCKGKNKAGKPCRAAALQGSRLCLFHAYPEKARQFGRLGGLKNRHVSAETVDPLPTADTALAVLNNSMQIMNDLYSGKLEPKIALSLHPFLNTQLRAIEILELEWYAQRDRERRSKEKSAETQLEGSVRGNRVAPPLDSAHLPAGDEKEETGDDPTSEDPSDPDCEEG
jgi:hypothetical protein